MDFGTTNDNKKYLKALYTALGDPTNFDIGGVGYKYGKWYDYSDTVVITGFGTCTGISFWWKRDFLSADLHGRGIFTCGTRTAVEARISLPLSLTSDATLIASIVQCGILTKDHTSNYVHYCLIEPGVSYITISEEAAGADGLTKLNGNSGSLYNNTKMTVNFVIPGITGWSI
jgi:hypothetical protein